MTTVLRPLAFLLPLSLATAQTAVVPPAYAAVEGNTLDREPFGLDGVRHVTYAHRDLLRSVPAATLVRTLAYRRDTDLRTQVLRRPQALWQIRMGSYSGSVAAPPSAWPSPGDPAWTRVLDPRFVAFPDLWLPAQGPAAFDLVFTLDRPFTYRGGHIGIEHFVADGIQRHDYFIDAIDGLVPGGSVGLMANGTGCPPGRNRAEGQAPNPGGGDLELYLFGAPPGAPAIAFVSASATSWLGLRLPLDLSPLGLPGCRVLCSPDFGLPAVATSTGLAEVALPVPGVAALLGANAWSQWWVADPSLNPTLPLALSDGLGITLGNHLNTSDVGLSVVSAFSGSNQWGFVQPNRGPIFRLGW